MTRTNHRVSILTDPKGPVLLPLTIRREAEVLEYLRVLASGDERADYQREID